MLGGGSEEHWLESGIYKLVAVYINRPSFPPFSRFH